MNENTPFERYVADAFDREGLGRPVPDAIHDDLLSHAGTSRQLPRLLASIKEPPMRLSNTLAVGSPTVRAAAIVVATLLLAALVAGAGIAGSRLLAADSAIIVDPSGDADYTTISEAVAVAEDGDTVLLQAGTYPESVTVSRSITLRGDDPGEVFIEVGNGCSADAETGASVCPADVPVFEGFWLESVPYGLLIEGTDAQVSDLGFRFPGHGSGIIVNGGAPVLSGITYDTSDGLDNLHVVGGSAAIIRDSDLGAGSLLVKERSPVTVEDSRFGVLELNTGDLIAHFMRPVSDIPEWMIGGPATVRGNQANHILIEGSALIEGNEVGPSAEDSPAIGIASGEGWIVRDNVVRGSTFDSGAILAALGDGLIAGNSLTDNAVGISVASAALVEGNTVTDGDVGIIVSLAEEETTSLVDNVVEDMDRVGISIGPWSDPVLIGNRSCNNGKDLRILGTRELTIDDSNEICDTDPGE